MARTSNSSSRQDLSFEFFSNLRMFYEQNKPLIRKHFKELSKRILDYNDPAKGNAYLRKPQFEALEMYVFLKEFTGNRKVHEIFDDWYNEKNGFETVTKGIATGQANLLKEMFFSSPDEYKKAFKYLSSLISLTSELTIA